MSVSRRTLSNPRAVGNIRPELIKVIGQSIDPDAQLSYFLLRSPVNIIAQPVEKVLVELGRKETSATAHPFSQRGRRKRTLA